MRLLTFVLGLGLGVLVLDDASTIDLLARFAGTDEAAFVAVLAYSFAVMVFGGSVLVFPAPRGAAIVLVLAGALGLVLGGTTIWQNALLWGPLALLLAVFAFVAHRLKRRKERRKARRASAAHTGGTSVIEEGRTG